VNAPTPVDISSRTQELSRADGPMLDFVCPSCHTPLSGVPDGWHCQVEQISFAREEGIPSFILPQRRAAVERFLADYRQVRRAEGWGDESTLYYRDLPYRDRSGRFRQIWRLRARSFDCFLDHLLQQTAGRHARVLDVGAGNGWCAARLAEHGLSLVALDINLDPLDGLGALGRTGGKISTVRADFDALPFAPSTFDVVVFNASLHYSPDILRTLGHAFRLLRDRGIVYIVDSPIYDDSGSGSSMLRERRETVRDRFGIALADDSPGSFLTTDLLREIPSTLQVEILSPRYGLRWQLRPLLARALRRRSPAAFKVIAVRKVHS